MGRRVVLAGLGLIALQLGFRAWAVFGSWFQFDDFAFLSRAYNNDLGWGYLTEAYGGHLMPGGFLLTWLFAGYDPLGYWPYAATLLFLQAVASIGFLRLLVHLFGRTAAILPLLALYLFSVISMPAFIWWAAGINQLPMQIALFFGLTSHVTYLRTRRVRYVFATLAWTVFGLLFYEKTLLVFLAYGLVALAYFATGPLGSRLRQLWRSYRSGLLLHGALALAYVSVYVVTSMNFNPNQANDTPVFPVAYRFIFKAFSTGIIGGPWHWMNLRPIGSVADPSDVVVFLSWLALGYLVYLAYTSRVNSVRAWSLTLTFLFANLLLLAAARAFLVGPVIGLEYRYQTELSAVFALSVGLAFLPLVGAQETVRPRGRAVLPFRPESAVAAVTVAFLVGSVISNLQYVRHWQDSNPGRGYFAAVERSLARQQDRVPLADQAVPSTIMWGFRYPENTYSRVLRLYEDEVRYPAVTNDRLFVFNDKGVLRPAAITSARVGLPHSGCGYLLHGSSVAIPLNGPVTGGGWWVRLGYLARSGGTMTVTAGRRVHHASIERGVHSLYFEASGDFDTIRLSAPSPGVSLCTNDVTLGLPEPYEKP
ncbi:MAG TPA: hypothetical protein VF165_10975 [Nocardioidaceae bacterium]